MAVVIMFMWLVGAFCRVLIGVQDGVRDEKGGEICIIARRFKRFCRLYSKEQHKIIICIIPRSRILNVTPLSHINENGCPDIGGILFGV